MSLAYIYEAVDRDGDRLLVFDNGRPDEVNVVVVEHGARQERLAAYADARTLRDALSAHLGDEVPAASIAAARLAAFAEGKAQGYREGVEAGRRESEVEHLGAAIARNEELVPHPVSAVEVEIFREADAARRAETWDLHDDARSTTATRSGLEAIEQYRAWRARA